MRGIKAAANLNELRLRWATFLEYLPRNLIGYVGINPDALEGGRN